MKENTVKMRIFRSNIRMLLVTLLLFAAINLLFAKIYWESIEREWAATSETILMADEVETLLVDITIRRSGFLPLLLMDAGLCVTVWLLVGQVFTRNLSRRVMEPLDALAEGVRRMQNHDLTEEIAYRGDAEFEMVCGAFNEMQRHMLLEQEKNRKYEKARTDMVAGISHDLRTPLTAVKGTLKALLDGVARQPEQQTLFLETAYRRAGEMETLLGKLFYLSRLETGNMPLDLQPVDLAGLAEQYTQIRQSSLQPSCETLTADLSDSRETVLADGEQLWRILDNLLENSRKYANVEMLQMKIAVTKAGENMRLRFSNNGELVARENLERIFEEFYREDESRNRKEGSGLGLYIVKYLTEAMGGRVWAESETEFAVVLEFPIRKEERGDD